MESKMAMLLVVVVVVGSASAASNETLTAKCSPEFQKVTNCLPFVSAKADTPSKDCCNSVSDIKDRDPACLCFLIQQIHNGSNSALKSMGIQEARLLQLSSSCKLTNASITQCPELLHLDPKSPDAAIFTNSSVTPSPATTSTGGGNSSGIWRKPQPVLVQLLLSIFFFFVNEMSSFPLY